MICGNYRIQMTRICLLTNHSTGACLLYGIARVVIGENRTFLGGESYLRQRGVEVVNIDNKECQDLMEKFIAEKPEVWCDHPYSAANITADFIKERGYR